MTEAFEVLYRKVRKVRIDLRDTASAFYLTQPRVALDPADLTQDDRIKAEATIILLGQVEAFARELRERIPDPKEREKPLSKPARERWSRQAGLDLPRSGRCPDGGYCHGRTLEAGSEPCPPGECVRVQTSEPLSGVFPGNRWPV